MIKLKNSHKMSLNEFINKNSKYFKNIDCPNDEFINDFHEMAYTKGC